MLETFPEIKEPPEVHFHAAIKGRTWDMLEQYEYHHWKVNLLSWFSYRDGGFYPFKVMSPAHNLVDEPINHIVIPCYTYNNW